MTRNPLDFIWQTPESFVVAFSKPRMPAPAPMPATPADDPAAREARANAEREAQVEAASGGRRSTIHAGLAGEDDNLMALGSMARRRGTRRGAAGDLGAA
jgi:hypothetical protein